MNAANARSHIQSLWIGPELSAMEQLSISSFLAHGYEFHLYVYNKVVGIPAGTKTIDANKIIPCEKVFKYPKYNSYAGFANMFRYKLLEQRGGYWVDVDIVCLRPFPENRDYLFAGQHTKPSKSPLEIRPFANNCVIKAPVGSKIMQLCYEKASACDTTTLQWGVTGPRLLSKAVKLFGLEDCVADPSEICPIPWWQWERIVADNTSDQIMSAKAYAIHLWQEQWRRYNIDKNRTFSSGSIYEYLKRLYIPGASS